MSDRRELASPLYAAAASRFARASLNGLVTFAPQSMAALVEVADAGAGILMAVNAEKIARSDPTTIAIAATHLAYPDGIGAVLALRRHGLAATRLPGAERLPEQALDRIADRAHSLLSAARTPPSTASVAPVM